MLKAYKKEKGDWRTYEERNVKLRSASSRTYSTARASFVLKTRRITATGVSVVAIAAALYPTY
jgi:hypothetical protein